MIIEDGYRANPVRTFMKAQLSRFPKIYEILLQRSKLRRDRNLAPRIREHIAYLEAQDQLPLFTQIHIETISRCNGGCSFCPVNRFDDPRPTERMKESLFRSIIDQLAAVEYTGLVYFQLNNEPLLDKRLYDFIDYARSRLPRAFLSVWTNGTALNLDKFRRLVTALDSLVIDNYNDDLVLNPPVQEIHDFCLANPEWGRKLRIKYRRENEMLDTRASGAPNRGYIETLASPCLYPFKQINVRPDGKISLCCNDALGAMTLGDLSTASILDVWHGESYDNIRKILRDGRKGIDICEGCDTLHCPSGKPGGQAKIGEAAEV